MLSLTCNNTACGGIREPNAVAFSSCYCERSELPSLFNARAVYIYIIIIYNNYIYIIVRASFRKCTSFLNSEYNFQFYWRVIKVRHKISGHWTDGALRSLLTLGAHAHIDIYLLNLLAQSNCSIYLLYLLTLSRVIVVVVCVCVYVCVTTHNCRLTHWNHKTEIPTCSQQYSDRFKFC